MEGLFIENSDEVYAHDIAIAIDKAFRSAKKIETTTDLRHLITTVILAEKDVKKLSRKSKRKQ